jgi:SAM-dependent methyltransferase
MSELYTEQFYDGQIEGSLRSATVYLGHLFSIWKPVSVVDIGCGRGAWLAACADNGIERLVGIDGDWVSQEKMVTQAITFRSADLNQEIAAAETFDLALSLEVAEHLKPASSVTFVRSLMHHSGAIVFSAAFASQPGWNHINTRLHSDWAARFLADGYQLFDFFRPYFWSDRRVEPWYRQNTFLYVRPAHPLHKALVLAGYRAQEDARFADAIHPWLYFEALGEIERLQKQRNPVAPHSAPANAVGRNEPCPCGSGKRYKHCHGRLASTAPE